MSNGLFLHCFLLLFAFGPAFIASFVWVSINHIWLFLDNIHRVHYFQNNELVFHLHSPLYKLLSPLLVLRTTMPTMAIEKTGSDQQKLYDDYVYTAACRSGKCYGRARPMIPWTRFRYRSVAQMRSIPGCRARRSNNGGTARKDTNGRALKSDHRHKGRRSPTSW